MTEIQFGMTVDKLKISWKKYLIKWLYYLRFSKYTIQIL